VTNIDSICGQRVENAGGAYESINGLYGPIFHILNMRGGVKGENGWAQWSIEIDA